MGPAYYNENDPFAAAWLRALIEEGCIAPGDVDDRSITAVDHIDLRGYAQCHFFAGIGAWSYALRLAGWPDDRPVWTGSCPCQPFSTAGKGGGFSDPRHLWPTWFRLIRERRPGVLFGEQVASPDGLAWLDLVHAGLEGAEYAVGVVDLPAAGIGAPHRRQRLGFVADAHNTERWTDCAPRHVGDWPQTRRVEGYGDPGERLASRALAHADGDRQGTGRGNPGQMSGLPEQARAPDDSPAIFGRGGPAVSLVGSYGAGRSWPETGTHGWPQPNAFGSGHAIRLGDAGAPGLSDTQLSLIRGAGWRPEGRAVEQPSRAPWADAEWLWCRDSSYRAAQPGSFPLVDGAANRMGLLRGFGNAIVPEQQAQLIGAYMDAASLQTAGVPA